MVAETMPEANGPNNRVVAHCVVDARNRNGRVERGIVIGDLNHTAVDAAALVGLFRRPMNGELHALGPGRKRSGQRQQQGKVPIVFGRLRRGRAVEDRRGGEQRDRRYLDEFPPQHGASPSL